MAPASREVLLKRLEKGRRVLAEKRAREKALGLVREQRPEKTVAVDAARELLPRILADEIAWRSSLLSVLSDLRRHLLDAIRDKLYNVDKATMPALAREARMLIESELTLIEKTRGMDLEANSTKQVTTLLARHALLRQQLIERGLMDKETGQLRMPVPPRGRVEQAAEPPNGKDLESGDGDQSSSPLSE